MPRHSPEWKEEVSRQAGENEHRVCWTQLRSSSDSIALSSSQDQRLALSQHTAREDSVEKKEEEGVGCFVQHAAYKVLRADN